MTSGKEPLNIVILGASFAGLSVAHHFLDNTLSRLGTTSAAQPYRLILISPSTHIYWNIGAPRKLVANSLIHDSEAFVAIEPGFRRHKDADVVFIQGNCLAWSPEKREVTIECIGARAQKRCSQVLSKRESGKADAASPKTPAISITASLSPPQTITYHALILATGTSAHSNLLSLHGPHTHTQSALKAFHKQLPSSTSIVVCGGGPSGVETAGQLATYLNHRSNMPAFLTGQQQKNLTLQDCPRKVITLVTGTTRLLPNLAEKVSRQAEKQLRSLGVRVIKNTRVVGTAADSKEYNSTAGSGGVNAGTKTRVTLSDGRTLLTDLFVAATGVSPNTAYAPPGLLDAAGYVATDALTLRVPGAGDRVYAIGDCASYSANYVLDVYAAVGPLMGNMHKDLVSFELRQANSYGGNDEQIASMPDVLFERKAVVDSQLCPITR